MADGANVTTGPMLTIIGLDHFVLRVRDLDAALAFYRDLLALPVLFLDEYRAGQRPFVSVRIGAQLLDLVPDATYNSAEGMSAGGFMHFCIEIDGAFDRIIPWLQQQGVSVLEEQPVPRMGARGMGWSIYVRDPDQYVVELKQRSA